MMSNFVFAQNKKTDTANYNRSVEEDLSYLVSEKEQIKAERKEKPLPLSKKVRFSYFMVGTEQLTAILTSTLPETDTIFN